MKRIAIVTCALAMAAGTANAQGLTMQMSNGWAFSFSGNVNAFLVYTSPKCNTTVLDGAGGTSGCSFSGSLVPTGEEEKISRIRTGLLPAFATFEAKGKEAGVDLGVHFGFAPQINNVGGVHDQFGAQIDMRQVYLTAGGTWGQVLAGREIGLYQRNNILNDMTLFGVGSSGGGAAPGGGGTTLGRIGFGYVYPNFVAQMTYSSPSTSPAQISIGLFDPSTIGPYDVIKIPRVESELTWTSHFGATTAEAPQGTNKFMLFVSGEWQHVQSPTGVFESGAQTSKDSYGGAGGVRADFSGLSLVGSGFYGKGIGSVLMFDSGNEVDGAGEFRNSYGFLGQAEFQPMGTQWKFGASYGENDLKQTTADDDTFGADNAPFVKKNSSIVGSVTYLWTKSLRWVAEYTYSKAKAHDGAEATSNQGALGMMLFF
jgi:hypothetical protein